MFEAWTLVWLILGTLLSAGAGIFFLAPESRKSRPPRRIPWALAVDFPADALAARSVRPRPVPRGAPSRTLHPALDLGIESPGRLASAPAQ